MDISKHTKEATEKNKPVKCPKCNKKMKALLFMGTTLDGYVCDACQTVFNVSDLMPLGQII